MLAASAPAGIRRLSDFQATTNYALDVPTALLKPIGATLAGVGSVEAAASRRRAHCDCLIFEIGPVSQLVGVDELLRTRREPRSKLQNEFRKMVL
jgi:hypothetical protein